TGKSLQPLFGPDGTITNGVGDSALSPITDWLSCWGPAFVGVPKEIPNATCRIAESIDQVMGAIGDLQKAIDKALGRLNWLIDPVGEIKDLVLKDLEPTLVDTALQVTTQVGGKPMNDIMRLVYFGATADT